VLAASGLKRNMLDITKERNEMSFRIDGRKGIFSK
jgi:hypothetical protein